MKTRMTIGCILVMLVAFTAPAAFMWQSEITISGYAGTETLTNFPVLVRLTAERVPGFRYTLCQADGRDIRFLAPDGVTVYPHEIDTWDASGESLVWVQIPEVSGTDTKFLFQFGDPDASSASSGAAVWNRSSAGSYAGVWHFNDAVTTGAESAADSAKRLPALNLDAVPSSGANGNLSQMMPTAGPIGMGRINASEDKANGNRLTVPSYDALNLGDSFTVSFWVKATGVAGKNGFFVSRKDASADANGWEVMRPGGSSFTTLRFYGTSTASANCVRTYLDASTDLAADWRHVVAVCDVSNAVCYVDGGVKSATCAAFFPATENGKPLVFGCDSDGNGDSFNGLIDEMRLLDAVVSGDWAKAEYDTVKSAAFLSATEAEKIGSGEVMCTVYVGISGGGSVLLNGEPAVVGENEVAEGATVQYSAVASAGNRFVSWRGNLPAGVDPTTPTIDVPTSPMPSLTACFTPTTHAGESGSWLGGASSAWLDGANWSGGEVPSDGMYVTLTGAGEVVVDMTTPRLGSLTVGSGTTLVLSNWTTRIAADLVTVLSGGRITCIGPFEDAGPSNRVWIVAGAVDVQTGGAIDADAKGYAPLNGPSWVGATKSPHYVAIGTTIYDVNCFGGAYGGRQGYPAFDGVSPTQASPSDYVQPQPYGSDEWPYQPGSGAGATNRPGGGAVFLDVSGGLTVNGRVSADCGAGASSFGTRQGGYGSGGGIVVRCRTITGNGSVTANGAGTNGQNGFGAGSGGRVAVHYDTSAQDEVSGCVVRFEARGAAGQYVNGCAATHARCVNYVSDAGTLWFSDNRFLTDAGYRAAGMPIAGTWRSGVALSELEYDGSLTIDGSLLRFDNTNFTLTIANDLVITGRNAIAVSRGIELVGGNLHVGGNANITCGGIRLVGGRLRVDGNLVVRSDRPKTESSTGRYAGEVRLLAAPTNAPGMHGVEAFVGGTWTLRPHAYCYLGSDPTNGAIPYVSVKSMVVEEGARVTAEGLGWTHCKGPGYAKVSSFQGGSYGGRAGGLDTYNLFGTTYGSERFPVDLGSGGKLDPGSGVVRLDVAKQLVVDGRITANALRINADSYCSGGSAGSVYITVRQLSGSGVISADASTGGKNGYTAGIGGGGRVAIYRRTTLSDTSALTVSAAAGHVNGTSGVSEAGTVYWGELAAPGFMLTIR